MPKPVSYRYVTENANGRMADFYKFKDRHWHIGEGYIGKEGFRGLINHPPIRTLPVIMETPRKDRVEDLKNMRVIRSLVEWLLYVLIF